MTLGQGGVAAIEAALARALDQGWGELRILSECRTGESMSSAEIHGSGVGVWNGERQFRATPDEIRDLLTAFSEAGFTRMPDRFGGRDDPAGHGPPILVCRVELSLDGATKHVAQLYRGRQSKELRRLADRILDSGRRWTLRESVTAESLEDGLEKIAAGTLAPESLYLHVNRSVAASVNGPPGDLWFLRVRGVTASVETQEPPARWTLVLEPERLAALARGLLEAEPSTLPGNLYAERYTDVVVRVLQHEAVLQARRFAGMEPERESAAQARFGGVMELAESLRREVTERGGATSLR